MKNHSDLLIFVTGQTHYSIRSYLDSYLQENGVSLTPPEAHICCVIDRNDGEPVPFPTLLKSMMVTKGTLSECLKAMKDKGLIDVIIDKDDRRKKSYRLLEKGKEVLEIHNRRFMEVERQLSKNLSPEEIETFIRISHTLIENAKEGL